MGYDGNFLGFCRKVFKISEARSIPCLIHAGSKRDVLEGALMIFVETVLNLFKSGEKSAHEEDNLLTVVQTRATV
jgi:hypothetical protein